MFDPTEDPGQVDVGRGIGGAVTAISDQPQRPSGLLIIAAMLEQREADVSHIDLPVVVAGKSIWEMSA